MNKIDVLDKGHVIYIDHYGSDQRIVDTARVSYNAESKGQEKDKRLLHYLYKHRHTSPFEQCMVTFNIKLPLFVQGQMVRHRTQKLNQVSARYIEMPYEFYIPQKWRKQDTKNKQGSVEEEDFNPIMCLRNFANHDEDATSDEIVAGKWLEVNASKELELQSRIAYNTYKKMLEKGIAREMARMILPQNLYTEIRTTWDLHNLMHFLRLRMDEHAQWEVQEYARAMYEITKEHFPWTMEAFNKYTWEIKE